MLGRQRGTKPLVRPFGGPAAIVRPHERDDALLLLDRARVIRAPVRIAMDQRLRPTPLVARVETLRLAVRQIQHPGGFNQRHITHPHARQYGPPLEFSTAHRCPLHLPLREEEQTLGDSSIDATRGHYH